MSKKGQSLIETCIAIAVLCLIFMGLFQISHIFAANEILYHAAARGARAKTVGFNWWMTEKCIRVAAIPNAGRILEPPFVNRVPALQTAVGEGPGKAWDWAVKTVPRSAQVDIELARIPEYLAAENWSRAHYILDYERWNTIRGIHDSSIISDSIYPLIHVVVYQDYHLTNFWGKLHRLFYSHKSFKMKGEAYLEAHYPLYIEDMGW